MTKLSARLINEQATVEMGRRLAQVLETGLVIYLEGDLGAGKTTLVRAMIQSLQQEARVKSPTYTLIERYIFPDFELIHLDLYRLNDPEEVEYLGLRDNQDKDVLLIEWPERGQGWIPAADWIVQLAYAESGRNIQVSAHSMRGQSLLKQVLEHS